MPTKVSGVINARKVLKQFNPDLLKEIQKEMRQALKPIVNQAKGFVPSDSPLSGWRKTDTFWSFDSAEMRRGITYSISPSAADDRGFKSLAQIINKSPMGAVWEKARNPQAWVGPKGEASKKKSRSYNPKAGAQFIAALDQGIQSSQGWGRGIRKAWAKDEGKAKAAVIKALEKMVSVADRKING